MNILDTGNNIVYTQLYIVHKISHEWSISINIAIQLHARFNIAPIWYTAIIFNILLNAGSVGF